MKENQKKNQSISLAKRLSYACGGAGGNVVTTLMGSYLLAYYTDTALIGAAAIGTMFVVCRLLDGVTDLAMGAVIDKTNTRWGKARPWLVLSAPMMAIGTILIVNVPTSFSEAMKLVYAYLTYIFLNCIAYTAYGISNTALLARMTWDPKERNTMTVIQTIGTKTAGLIVGTVITVMELKLGWTVTGIILGVVTGGLILIPGLAIPEVVGMEEGVEKPPQVPMKTQLSVVLRSRYFYLSLILGAFTLLLNSNAIGSQIYYCKVILKDPMFMAQLMSIGQLPSILILFVMPYFSNRFSKRAFMSMGAVTVIIGFAISGIADTNRTLILAGCILRNLGTSPIFAGIYALTADSCDYCEWKTGIRSEGLFSASQSIGAKLGIGFGSALTGWILGMVGYNPLAEVFTAKVIMGIKFDFAWLGVILGVVLLFCIIGMDVEKYLPQIRAEKNAVREV